MSRAAGIRKPTRPPVTGLLWGALASAVVTALVWMLWALPIAASVREATPLKTGASTTVPAGQEVVGVWAYGRSATLGTLECSVDGAPAQAWGGPSLGWDDMLWWVPGRLGYKQILQVRLDAASSHEIVCQDSLGTYEADYLIARDAFGTANIGLGPAGSMDFPTGTIFPFVAVATPFFVVAFPIMALINTIRRRSSKPGAGL